jgi:serine protease
MPTVQMAQKSRPQASNATYRGGPLLYKPKMYLIFWGFTGAGDPDNVAPLLESYEASIGHTAYNQIYTQYKGTKKFIKNPKAQNGSYWFDDTNAIPTSPTDEQVAQESLLGEAHFGAYDPNGSYVVVTAHNHNSQGFGSSFCAYHSSINDSGGHTVSYTNMPYIPDAGNSCGAGFLSSPPSDETSADEGVTIVTGHEYGESITDPIPGEGWYDNQWGEIGDICAWTNIQIDKYGKNQFVAQPMWSNASSSCVHSYKKPK